MHLFLDVRWNKTNNKTQEWSEWRWANRKRWDSKMTDSTGLCWLNIKQRSGGFLALFDYQTGFTYLPYIWFTNIGIKKSLHIMDPRPNWQEVFLSNTLIVSSEKVITRWDR